MPRIGITGWKGMVGHELLKYPDTIPLMCDVRFPDDIEAAVKKIRPDIIVHLAGISRVDECEISENEKFIMDTNVGGTYNVADVGERYGCGVVLMSSVHVFDGLWGNYSEKNKPSPKNFYGYSKMGAESLGNPFPNLKVVRTSYLFDHKRLFADIYALRRGCVIEQPLFMYRSFMYLSHYVESLYQYLCRFDEMPKVLHISGSNTVSWYTFMKDLAHTFQLDANLVHARTQEIKNVVPRPYKGGLNVKLSKNLGLPQFSHLEGLQAMKELI